MTEAKQFLAIGLIALSPLAISLASADTPLVSTQLVTIIDQKKCANKQEEKLCAEMDIDVELTSITWLDHELLERLDIAEDADHYPASISDHITQVKRNAQHRMDEQYAELEEVAQSDDPFFLEYQTDTNIRFTGQKQNLAAFTEDYYVFSGGAHGLSNTIHVLYDLDSQRQLLLEDIINPDANLKMLSALENRYSEKYPDFADWLDGNSVEEKAEILLTDDLVLNNNGLILHYGPYALGPYSAGPMSLELPFSELEGAVREQYLPK